MSRRCAALLLSWGVLAAGCGVDPQAAPEDLDVDPLPPAAAAAEVTGSSAGRGLVLWFADGDRLVPVDRSARDPGPQAALDLLAEGLTADEAAAGLTTAITEQPLTVAEGGADDVLVVEVTPAFTGVAGADQLTAVAQVVWTMTGFDGVDEVRFATDDGPLEVPTDAGLGAGPVGRDDYPSLGPA